MNQTLGCILLGCVFVSVEGRRIITDKFYGFFPTNTWLFKNLTDHPPLYFPENKLEMYKPP